MKDRIKEVRESFGLTQRDFSRKIDVGQSTLAQFERGDRTPRDIHIKRICAEFDIDENWLRTGNGSMIPIRTVDEKIASLTGRLFAEDNDFKKKMIGMMLEMTDDEWELFEKLIDRLSSK